MKKFNVKIENYIWLTSDQIDFVMRLAPTYVTLDKYGVSMMINDFKTLREARVFIRSFYAIMDAAKVNLMPRDKTGIHLIRASTV